MMEPALYSQFSSNYPLLLTTFMKRPVDLYPNEEGIAKGKITKWMLPDYIVITNDIPKTSVGKFDKKVIQSLIDNFLEKAVKVRK